jgi:hypothetical protein
MYDIIDIKTGQVVQVKKIELDFLLKKHVIHYHHSLKMFCYTKKKYGI